MTAGETCNGRAIVLPQESGMAPLGEFLRKEVAAGGRIVAFFGTGRVGDVGLTAVVAHDAKGVLHIARARTAEASFKSLTHDMTGLHLFEREIYEQTGLRPEGHPWLKPVRFTRPGDVPGVMPYYQVQGEAVHEVAVGPVHAGVIEPGHFRFQCHGEQVFHLEISLGYQHRGIERTLVEGPEKRLLHLAETLCGDTTLGHVTAHCEAMEALAGVQVPVRAQAIRAIALELERLANHVGDLGAMAGDVAFLPTASFCGRIRGDFLNLTAALCGNRFGRGLVVPGGVAFDVEEGRVAGLLTRLQETWRDTQGAVDLLWDAPAVMDRFSDTGMVPEAIAKKLGLVGPAARASGLERDVRMDHPSGFYKFSQVPVSGVRSGDVFARAWVRWLECLRAVEFVREQLKTLPEGPVRVPMLPLRPERMVVALAEGWRGEIAHVVATDSEGHVAGYKVVDPSFHNWAGLAMAMREQAISDFPLCNKSFNLSYCGHDL